VGEGAEGQRGLWGNFGSEEGAGGREGCFVPEALSHVSVDVHVLKRSCEESTYRSYSPPSKS